MKWAIVIFAMAVLASSPARASDECKIEAWRAYSPISTMLMIEGSTTCAKGEIKIRLYSGSGKSAKFIGVAEGFINGNAFQVMALQVTKPAELTIKYAIDTEGGL